MSSSCSSTQEKKATLRPPQSQGRVFDDKPLWNHVKVLSISAGGGGNRRWSCNYCTKTATGSYSKVKAHLLRLPGHGISVCPSIGDDILQAIKREHEGAEVRRAQDSLNERKKVEYASLPPNSDLIQPKKRKGSLETTFNVAQRDIADKECARMFYASALAFNFARSPYFRKYSQTLANSNLHGYVPPTYNRLRTTLLAQEKAHMNRLLQPLRDTWPKKGVSIVSDGWSDRQRRPLINIMASSAGSAMFVKSIDASGDKKDADYVANVFLQVIKDVGASNIVQIVTDNGSNFKAAGLSIEGMYPHIFWTPCVVHSLNLALKSICDPSEKSPQYDQCKWLAELVNEVQNIRNFIVNHGMASSIFKSYSSLSLLKVAETRFASSIVMCRRLKDVRVALEQMVMDADWKHYRGDGNTLAEIKAREVKKCIVDDLWWDKLDYMLKFTEPIHDMLRVADTDTPVLHLVYGMWDSMIESGKKIIFEHEMKDIITCQSDFFNAIQQILESRWTKSNTPLHCLAHSLVPKYYCNSWLQGENVEVPRIAPHEDREVSQNRNKCFKRLFQNPHDLKQVFLEYGAFSSGIDYFNQAHVLDAREYGEPLSWWANHGASTLLLQALAFKLLAQPASSSCSERNWSTHSLIQSIKRNKLATSRAEDLVFVHSNLRLLSRKNKEYTEEPTKYWDLCGDIFNFDGGASEFASLSLDEPVLEAMSFEEEENEEEGLGASGLEELE